MRFYVVLNPRKLSILKFFGNGTPLMNVDWWKFE